MKIFKRNKFVKIEFSDGDTFITDSCSDSLWKTISENSENEEAVRLATTAQDSQEVYMTENMFSDSNLLEVRGNYVCMPSVSEISIPSDFCSKILEAEKSGNETEINRWVNFWTLVSLNPDARVRDNIFWFIRRWSMKISESGFIIAYRNVDIKKESRYSREEIQNIINMYYTEKYLNNNDVTEIYIDGRKLSDLYFAVTQGNDVPIYTDHHTHSMIIKLGTPVSIPRSECDAEQEHSCSQGLHVAATNWLESGYYGGLGLQVLVNPANVVAVPTIDNYGKMRTCEYFPVTIIDYDEDGHVIESPISLYNDCEYLKYIKYDGIINNQDDIPYEVIRMKQNAEDMYDRILRRLHGNR